MKVFISWSGQRSLAVARAISDFLPLVLQPVRVWSSVDDVDAGQRWSAEIMSALETAGIALICVTRDSLKSPWLLFEAGALSKSRVPTFVVNVDVSPVDVSGPLAHFQFVTLARDDVFRLVDFLNKRLERAVKVDVLETLFDALWPRFVAKLNELPPPESAATDMSITFTNPPFLMTDHDMLRELLETVRKIASKLDVR